MGGQGRDGRLGHGDQEHQLLPKKVEALAGQRVIAVSAGGEHSLAITADGVVWSWGFGVDSQLGHGDMQNQLLPKKVEAFAEQRVNAVSAGTGHSLAITADGAVWSWGRGGIGRLGHGDEHSQLLPKKIEALAGQRIAAVSAGVRHSLALTADSAVFTWGQGECGIVGHGEDLSSQLLPKPKREGRRVGAGSVRRRGVGCPCKVLLLPGRPSHREVRRFGFIFDVSINVQTARAKRGCRRRPRRRSQREHRGRRCC